MNRINTASLRKSRVVTYLGAFLLMFTSLTLADVNPHAQADQLLAEAARLAPAAEAVAMNFTAVSPTQYSTLGNWSAVIPWTPHVPVTCAQLPDGRLLTFASNERNTFPEGREFTYAATWDYRTGQFVEINNTRHDMFCGGVAMLPDGRVLVNGGRNVTVLSSIFDWRTNAWSAVPDMKDGRWYNTTVALPNGTAFTASGSGGSDTAERWQDGIGWTRLTNINWALAHSEGGLESIWHPFLHVAPDGRIAHSGPTDSMHWVNPTGNGQFIDTGVDVPGSYYPKDGALVMFDTGKIIYAAGRNLVTGASNLAYVVDINGATPTVTPTGNVINPRTFANGVVLPNGEVMMIGGNTSQIKFSDEGSVLTPEIWNPQTGQWRAVADASVPRNYHSLAVLLPDGRVWSGGGGLSGNAADHPDAQIYTPGALFNNDGTAATRPVITSAPAEIGPGMAFSVTATAGMQKFTFIKLSALTHSVTSDLRFLNLPFTENSAGAYTVNAHTNINVMTPGYWMLFAISPTGPYSVSKIIRVSTDNVPTVINPGAQITQINQSVSLQIAASGPGTFTYSASGLPTGLSIGSNTGVISGVPTATGSYNVIVSVTSSLGPVGMQQFNWTVTPANQGTGSILREWWLGITGKLIANLTASASYPNSPTGSDKISSFETPTDWADNMGQRVRGWLYPPVSGQYRFWISSDDEARLLLSTNDLAANAVQIANQPDWTPPRTWNWYPQQTSVLISLQAGQRYYIEALMKEGGSGDNLAVAWEIPGTGSGPVIIAGTYLAPWTLNSPPVVTNPGTRNNLAGDVVALQIVASDANNDPLTYSATGLPTGLSINANTGLITGIAGSAITTNTTVVSVTDGKSPAVTASFTWNMNVVIGVPNTPPLVTNPGTQSSVIGNVVSLQIIATDAESDPLTYSATGLPPGLNITTNSGFITGSPTAAGTSTTVISVSDGKNPAVSTNFTWNVNALLALQPLSGAPAPVNTAITFTAASTGGLNPQYKWNFGDGSPETTFSAYTTVTKTYSAPGRFIVTLTARDSTGREVTTSYRQAIHSALTPSQPTISSSMAYQLRSGANARLWVVNPDQNSVTVFDAVTRARSSIINVGTAPRSVAIAPDGRAWVVNSESATISIISTSLTIAQTVTLPRGSRPFAVVFDPAGANAYVSLQDTGRVLKISRTTPTTTLGSTFVGSDVRHLSVSADGTKVYATRFITPRLPSEETATVITQQGTTKFGGVVAVITASSMVVAKTIILEHSNEIDSSIAGRGIPNYLGPAVLSPDGRTAWVPSQKDNIKRGTLRDGQPLTHDSSVRSITSRIDLLTDIEDFSARIDYNDAGIPSTAAFERTGSYLFTALEGSREVVVVDSWGKREILRFAAGRAPQGVVTSPDGRTLYVHNFMDRSVTVHDVSAIINGFETAPILTATLPCIATEALSAQVLLGKQLFYDASDSRLALQQYISCASCHNDGGHDGRVWDLTGFGEGLRNTITLKGHGNHGALHWTGNFDEVQDFEGQIRNLAGGTGLISGGTPNPPLGTANAGRSADLDALAAYVKSLTVNGNSPNRTSSGALSADATAGQQIFRAQNCAACHSGANFTNSALNVFANIGTMKPSSGKRLGAPLTGLDVPTLRGVWATAPYLHDGSAATLADAITAHQGVSLSATDMPKLVAYVSSIDDAPTSAPLPFAVVLSTTGPSVTAAFNVTVIFNSAATGFTLSDIVVTNGVASNFSGSVAAYTFTVTPTVPGVVTVSVPAGAAADSTSLGNTVSNLLSVNYTSTDTTPPTVVLSTSATAVTAPFVVTTTFSENVSGLLASEYSVTNGTVTALSAAGAVWSATVTPTAAGNVTVTLPAGMAQDAGGNGNFASNTLTVNYSVPVAMNGITADYYSGKNFEQFVLNRIDPNIDFTWSAAPGAGLPADGFSVRWQGTIVPRSSGVFDFITRSDDGVRLWLNGVQVINNWTNHGETWDYATLTLNAGVPVTVKMEFYENTSSAMARLFWDGPGANFVAIPQSALRPLGSAPLSMTLTSTASRTISLGASIAPVNTDGDDASDLIEQALGTSITSGITQPGEGLQLTTRANNAVDATLLRPAGQSGITFALEASNDLVNWAALAVSPTIVSLGNGWERVTWSNLPAAAGQSLARGIVRLRVTQSGGTTATSAPLGWQQAALRTGIQSFGLNLTNTPVFTGAVSSATATSITLAEQAALAAARVPTLRYYLEILNGPNAGHRFDLQSITPTSCVIAADSTNSTLTSAASISWTGIRIAIRSHQTLATVFDPLRFQGSPLIASADQVLYHTGTAYRTYWLYANAGERRWVLNGDTTLANAADTLIPPGTGLMLQLANATPSPLLLTGSVRTTPLARVLTSGYNLVANPWPVDATPAATGLTTAAFVASTSIASADQLQLWSGDANVALSGYTGYWLFQMPGQLIPFWVATSDATLLSQNNTTLLRAGRATFIKAQTKTNRPVWVIPPP